MQSIHIHSPLEMYRYARNWGEAISAVLLCLAIFLMFIVPLPLIRYGYGSLFDTQKDDRRP